MKQAASTQHVGSLNQPAANKFTASQGDSPSSKVLASKLAERGLITQNMAQ
jgi:hypothetical protein